MPGVRSYPNSEYDAWCAYCGGDVARIEPRIRANEPVFGAKGRRTWHTDCYGADPEGLSYLGEPSSRGFQGPPTRSARGVRPSSGAPGGSASPSDASPPAGSSPAPNQGTLPGANHYVPPAQRDPYGTPRELGYVHVTTEAEMALPVDGLRAIVRVSELCSSVIRDATAEQHREYIRKNLVKSINVLIVEKDAMPRREASDGPSA
ncbi:MAG: hypothetical protein ACREB9_01415 [Thermoplasmata archaeon]